MAYDPQTLADAETHLIHVLQSSTPARDADLYHITEAAQDYLEHNDGDIRSADQDVVEKLLAKHAK